MIGQRGKSNFSSSLSRTELHFEGHANNKRAWIKLRFVSRQGRREVKSSWRQITKRKKEKKAVGAYRDEADFQLKYGRQHY